MPSSVKMGMDTGGHWKPCESNETMSITKFFLGIDDSQIKQDIMDIEPIQEWFCGVVCVSKVEKFAPGNNLINWAPPRYLINTRAYELPMDINKIVSDVFDLSLNHKILGVNPKMATIYVMESKDETTNITDEIVELIFEVVKRPFNTLYEELQEEGLQVVI